MKYLAETLANNPALASRPGGTVRYSSRSRSVPPGQPRLAARAGLNADVLDRLVEAAAGGGRWALVMHGEPGVGRTALSDYMTGRVAATDQVSARVFMDATAWPGVDRGCHK